jgi:transcriptional regulator with XRE-family HTH domain
MQDQNAAHDREVRANGRKGRRNSQTSAGVLRQLAERVTSTDHGLCAPGQVSRGRPWREATEYPMSKRPKQHVEGSEQDRPSRPPAEVLPVVARNLSRLRVKRGLSLDQLAERSGVSLSLLEALSRGEHEPNIKTLWSLANVLGVPFRALIADDPAGDVSQDPAPQVSSRRLLASRDGDRNSEVYEIKLSVQASETAEPRRKGATENVLVSHGSAEIRAGALHYTLHEGESISFRADQARHYGSLGDAAATLYVVISQPVD